MNGIQHSLIFLVRVYQKVLSPAKMALFGPLGECRYQPCCSEYAAEAVRVHGAVKGSVLAAWRICRCNPWGRFGADPVPPKGGGQISSSQTTPARVITLAPRGTSGERDGERGFVIEQPPLPLPLLHFVEEREEDQSARANITLDPAQSRKFSTAVNRCTCGGSHSAAAAAGPRA